MFSSTYQEQGRPEVWFFPASSHSGGGFAFGETAPAGFGVLCAGPGCGGNNYTGFLFPVCPADGVREELVLQQCHCWSLMTQINPLYLSVSPLPWFPSSQIANVTVLSS